MTKDRFSHRKNVVVIGSFAPSLLNFRGNLLRSMVQRGYQVTACAPEASAEVVQSLKDIGVFYKSLPVDRTGKNPIKDCILFFSVLILLLKERPRFLLTYTIKPVIFGSLAAALIPGVSSSSIITGLGYMFSEKAGKRSLLFAVVTFLYKLALKSNKTVIFQNPDDRNLFQELHLTENRRNVVVNGSGVDLNHYSYAPPASGTSFLLIARLLKNKGIYEYVEAARIIKRKYPETEFSLVGWIDSNPSAIKQEELSSWIEEGVVNYLGKLEDVRPVIRKCTTYVLPSYREGTPRTVLEAMSVGRAIITTDVPGCRETVAHGINGFLVEKGEVAPLAYAMEKFIKNRELAVRMGRESRKIAQEKYDVEIVSRSIITAMGM